MIASVEEEVLQRFHVDVVPLDISCAMEDVRPDSDWIPKNLYEGAGGLLPPGTGIGTDSEGRWSLLDRNGNPTSFRMPREGYYFDNISFNQPGAVIDPATFRPTSRQKTLSPCWMPPMNMPDCRFLLERVFFLETRRGHSVC